MITLGIPSGKQYCSRKHNELKSSILSQMDKTGRMLPPMQRSSRKSYKKCNKFCSWWVHIKTSYMWSGTTIHWIAKHKWVNSYYISIVGNPL